jgi:hypothetical protein
MPVPMWSIWCSTLWVCRGWSSWDFDRVAYCGWSWLEPRNLFGGAGAQPRVIKEVGSGEQSGCWWCGTEKEREMGAKAHEMVNNSGGAPPHRLDNQSLVKTRDGQNDSNEVLHCTSWRRRAAPISSERVGVALNSLFPQPG